MRDNIIAMRGSWSLRFELPGGAIAGQLFRIESDGEPFLYAEKLDEALRIRIETENEFGAQGRHRLTFELSAPADAREYLVEWLGYSVSLWADGEKADEEWPIGALPAGNWNLNTTCDEVRPEFAPPCIRTPAARTGLSGPMQFFGYLSDHAGVGDCMPFARNGRYCLYYLFDRRGHKSKAGLGAHQWAQISSDDLRTWTVHPLAIPIGEQWEGSICTGSLIRKDDLIYAFYAVRMTDGSPARLSWAISADGERFEKSGEYFTLTEPYESVSARDPMVFQDGTGLYHMLLTTSLLALKRHGGCLAHLISADLKNWEQLEPMLVPGYADQPECSDYFAWNGWYYLIFSNFATARYRMSRQPFGPWVRPESDILDCIENQVPKTAAFGNRRFLTGFLARYPRTYAGNAVTHELFQQADGTLGVMFVPEILPPALGETQILSDIELNAAEGLSDRTLASGVGSFRVRAHLTVASGIEEFGFWLRMDQDDYILAFDPAAKMVRVLRPGQHFMMGEARNQITRVPISDTLSLDIVFYRDMLDLSLSSGRALCMRMNGDVKDAEFGAFARWGLLTLHHVELTPLDS